MKLKATLVLVILTLTLAACKNIPPVTSGIGTKMISPNDDYTLNLVIDNKKLASQLFISDIKSRHNNSFLEINLAMTSSYEKSLNLQYQFTWFDKDGFVIESGKNPWQALELHGKQTINVRGLALSKNAVSYSFYVREVNDKYYKY